VSAYDSSYPYVFPFSIIFSSTVTLHMPITVWVTLQRNVVIFSYLFIYSLTYFFLSLTVSVIKFSLTARNSALYVGILRIYFPYWFWIPCDICFFEQSKNYWNIKVLLISFDKGCRVVSVYGDVVISKYRQGCLNFEMLNHVVFLDELNVLTKLLESTF